MGYLSSCIDNSSILACLARSVSWQQIHFNFLAIFRLIFSEESFSHFQFSVQTFFLSLSLISPLIRLLWLQSLGLELLIDLTKGNIRISQFPMLNVHISARPLQLSVQGFCGDFACLSMFAQRFGLGLSSPLTQTREDLKQLFHDPCPHKFPWRQPGLQQNRNLPTLSWD